MPNTPARRPAPLAVNAAKLPGTFAEVKATIDRAQRGDEAAVPKVREYLAAVGPDALGGNLAREAADALLAAHCGANLFVREATARKMADLRAELAGPAPTAVERLLAERAVCCWLHLHHLELRYAAQPSLALDLAGYYQKAIDRAHRRYLTALKALAEVRRLGVTVQVNVARRQVNVAGGPAPAAG